MNSFFMNFAFDDRISGLSGNFTGNKIYSVDYFDQVEQLIADAHKILKTKRDAVVTFQSFDGYGTTDLIRLFRDYDGSMTRVEWKRNRNGFAVETIKHEHLPIAKKEIKSAALAAIDLFRTEVQESA